MITILLTLVVLTITLVQTDAISVSAKCTSYGGVAKITVDAMDKAAQVVVKCDVLTMGPLRKSIYNNTFTARVAYGTNNCNFTEEGNQAAYVNIIVNYDPNNGDLPFPFTKQWKVTCNPQDKQADGIVEEIEVEMDAVQYDEPVEVVTIPLQLKDKSGNLLDPSNVPMSANVQLVGNTAEHSSEGLTVVSCDMVGGDVRVQILQEGCGNSMIFDYDKGFEINGNVVTSPFFQYNPLEGAEEMHYLCNFTSCEESCSGSSCSPRIVKRSAESHGEFQSGYIVNTALAATLVSTAAYAWCGLITACYVVKLLTH